MGLSRLYFAVVERGRVYISGTKRVKHAMERNVILRRTGRRARADEVSGAAA